jgi:hypothetical protein
MLLSVARLAAITRRILPWLVGVVACVLRGGLVDLSPPSRCSAFLDLLAITAVRAERDLAIGDLIRLLYVLAMVTALAGFVELVFRSTRNLAVATVTGLAVGLSPLFPRTLALPWEAAAFGLSVTWALVFGWLRDGYPHRSISRLFLAGVVLLLSALVVPPWTIIAAIGVALTPSFVYPARNRATRWIAGSVAAGGLVAMTFLALRASSADLRWTPSLQSSVASCMVMLPAIPGDLATMTSLASSAGWLFGPFAASAGILGLFIEAREAREASRRGWRWPATVAVVGVIGLFLAFGATVSRRALMAPLIVVSWWLVAIGLHEIVKTMARSRFRRIAAGALLALVPVLQLTRLRSEQSDDQLPLRGHEQVTFREMTAIMNALRPNAVLVEEDASVDVFVRAVGFGGHRTTKPFTMVHRDADAIRRALEASPVYAFPSGQQDLSLRGFVIEPVTIGFRRADEVGNRIAGVAAVTAARPCVAVAGEWSDLSSTLTEGRIAMSAESETDSGPVVMYLGRSSQAEPRPDGWPPSATPGFHVDTFDQREPSARASLIAAAGADGVPNEQAVLKQPFITRLRVYRTPRAPLALPILLGGGFTAGIAKAGGEDGQAPRLTICDAPAVQIEPFAARAR